jgi:hypothetical protein
LRKRNPELRVAVKLNSVSVQCRTERTFSVEGAHAMWFSSLSGNQTTAPATPRAIGEKPLKGLVI